MERLKTEKVKRSKSLPTISNVLYLRLFYVKKIKISQDLSHRRRFCCLIIVSRVKNLSNMADLLQT